MLHQSVDGALVCRIRGFRSNNGARRERREENVLLPLHMIEAAAALKEW